MITVYNFEIEDFHTYFASDAIVLVHNDYSGVRRKGAFREAKRDVGIYKSQQPYESGSDHMRTAEHEGSKIILGKNNKPIKTREYNFINYKGKKIIIQDNGAKHLKGGQGPHFNVIPANKKLVSFRELNYIILITNDREVIACGMNY